MVVVVGGGILYADKQRICEAYFANSLGLAQSFGGPEARE